MKRLWRLSPQAEKELDEIWVSIARERLSAADKVTARIIQTLAVLADFPLLGRARPELREGVRGLPVGRYVIFYVAQPYGVYVLHILWGGRDIRAIFAKDMN